MNQLKQTCRLYYIHDPMCSWCYAFENILGQLESALADCCSLERIVGGLAPDSTDPMPESLQKSIRYNWQQIEKALPQIRFNYDFWEKNQPIRSTYPACRAVLSAKQQDPEFEKKMIQQIQYAYYQNAENPSLDQTLLKCAEQIGLNEAVFKKDYRSQMIDNELIKQINFSRSIGVTSFPSLRLDINQQIFPIKVVYDNVETMLEPIKELI